MCNTRCGRSLVIMRCLARFLDSAVARPKMRSLIGPATFAYGLADRYLEVADLAKMLIFSMLTVE